MGDEPTTYILFASKPTSLRVGSADGRPLYPFRHPSNSLDNFTGLMDSPHRSIDPQFSYCVAFDYRRTDYGEAGLVVGLLVVAGPNQFN